MPKVRPYKPGKYGKGTIPDQAHPEAQIWRTKGGWDGDPHHDDVSEALGLTRPMVVFHIDRDGRFYFHHTGTGHLKPKDPAGLARAVAKQHPDLTWGGESVEQHEAGSKTLAINGRQLRPFEQGAHLHVLDWTHKTVRTRFQEAGAIQVKAASKAVVANTTAVGSLTLPSLEAAIHGELRQLYALGHATVRSELAHQALQAALPIGPSAAPQPPNLRQAKGAKKRCGTCKMFDNGSCWGYGNYGVEPDEMCDSWAAETVKTLATMPQPRDHGSLAARARLVAQAVAHAIWQAVHRARLQGVSDPKALKRIGRDAGSQALAQAATHHAGGAINAGRHAAALTVLPGGGVGRGQGAKVTGARYTSVLDKNSCQPCIDADDGVLRSLDDPNLVHPPNNACLGGDRCRCILVYQLDTETGAGPTSDKAATVPDDFPAEPAQPDRVAAIKRTAVAQVGVGGS